MRSDRHLGIGGVHHRRSRGRYDHRGVDLFLKCLHIGGRCCPQKALGIVAIPDPGSQRDFLGARALLDALLAGSQSNLVRNILEVDGEYLLRAYEQVEQFWQAQFHAIQRVNLVLLSEAPLFGEQKRSYIYNPEAGATPFFNYKDYAKTFEGHGPLLSTTGSVAARKTALLAALRELGVLIVDLFPFALNKKTCVNYSALRPSEHTELFEATCPIFFRLKLQSILRKATPQTLFVFRYERVRKACEQLVQTEFASLQIDLARLVSEGISAPRGIIRHKPLRAVYERSLAAKC